MSPSNSSPKKSGNPLEEEAERVEEADGMADTKKIRLSKSTGSMYVWIHRDWVSMHWVYEDKYQMES